MYYFLLTCCRLEKNQMNLQVDSPLKFRTKSDSSALLLPCYYIGLGGFKQRQTKIYRYIVSWYILILFKFNEKFKKPTNMRPKPKRTSTLVSK